MTAVTFNVAADLVAQCIVKSKGKGSWMSWDTLPPLRLAFWGVLCTPLVDHWLAFLDSTFGDGSDYVTLGKKLCIDQLLFGPFLFSTFLIFVGAFDALTSKHKFAATFDGFFANVLQGHLAGMAFWLPVLPPCPASLSSFPLSPFCTLLCALCHPALPSLPSALSSLHSYLFPLPAALLHSRVPCRDEFHLHCSGR